MKGRKLVFTVLASVLGLSAVGSFSYLMVRKYMPVNSEVSSINPDRVEIKSEKLVSRSDKNLGVLNTGETKSQKILISSDIDFTSYYSLAFFSESAPSVCKNITLNVYRDDGFVVSERMDKVLNNEDFVIEGRIAPKEETEIRIDYVLDEDISKDCVNQKVDFSVVVNARNVLG